MNYRIRLYREADTRELMALFYETIHTVNARDYSPEQIDAWSPDPPDAMDYGRWAATLGSRYTVVAEAENGLLIGFAELEPTESVNSCGHVDRFYGHKDFQGIGVGSALLAAIEQEAERRQMSRLFTEASITAEPFFERRGFQMIAEQVVERRGVGLTNFRMEKTLG